MARALCDNCQKEFYWYGGRGCRLQDVLSPCCQTSAHSRKVERAKTVLTEGARIRASVLYAWALFVKAGEMCLPEPHWDREKIRQLTLLPDGKIYISRDWNAYTPDSDPVQVSGELWRALRFQDATRKYDSNASDIEGCWYLRRVRESDYQRLIAKRGQNEDTA